ncbi:MAG: endolytic transglycosylase MltG [Pseudomonadota bacterium]
MNEQACPRCKHRFLQLLVVLVVFALGTIGVIYSRYQHFSQTPITLPQDPYIFTVSEGTSLGLLARRLHAAGIIRYPRFFIQLGRRLDAARHLKVGEYTLTGDLTPTALLELMTEGRVLQYGLTLIEGQTFTEMLARVAAHPSLQHTLTGLDTTAIMERIGHPGEQPEGRFLADTYHFPRNTTDVEFLRRAWDAMEAYLQRAWEQRAEGLPLASPYEALILASIVEKETGLAEERARIAGVFLRRLQKGMKLQTDPTVIYGMGQHFDGNLRRADLMRDTPYNTYMRDGLPPTPIAMPGREAIDAVLHPAAGDSLYFVARGGGSHYFSSTLDEHNRAVDKYQRGKSGIDLPGEEDAQ